MSWNNIEGEWREARPKLQRRWQKLTDEDLNTIAGRREKLIGVLRRKYGEGQEEIERQVNDFEEKYTTM